MERFSQKRQQVATALREIAENLPGERLLVGKVMTRDPITISMDATVLQLVQLFHAKEFRHPLVTDHEGCLVGVVSDRDVIRCFGPDKYPQEDVLNSITTAEIMSTDLVTTSPETSLENAVELLFGYGINCLPVVSHGMLVGILTTTDLYLVLEGLLAGLRRTPEAWDLEALQQD
jgi:acetoin utilization protein AcuB